MPTQENPMHQWFRSMPETQEAALATERCLRCMQTGRMRYMAGPYVNANGVWHVRGRCVVCVGATGQTAAFKVYEVGDPVTFLEGPDCSPGRIVQIYGDASSRRRWVEVMRFETVSAYQGDVPQGHQTWEILWGKPSWADPRKYSLRASGRWARSGEPYKSLDQIIIGRAQRFYDWHADRKEVPA